MKVLAVGGGSGGHVTPVLAVINELSKQSSDLDVLFVCDKAFEAQSRGLMKHASVPVEVTTVPAGKFRRYHGESTLDKLKDVRTIFFNIRDIFFIAAGFLKSAYILLTFRPDVVFAKGGYVCLPLGLAAAMLRIPMVLHDSDTRPGLTNNVLARFARHIATGSPIENYSYDLSKTTYVGVPIQSEFTTFSEQEVRQARHDLGVVDVTAPLVVITGGGLGSKSINEAMLRSAQLLIDQGIQVYHITGKSHYDDVTSRAPSHAHYMVAPFVYKGMHAVLGAADVVVSRASATFIQELAGLSKAAILVPAAHLGDQNKNAKVYEEAKAALVLTDDAIKDSDTLGRTIVSLMNAEKVREKLADTLHSFARPHAAHDVAEMVVASARKHRG